MWQEIGAQFGGVAGDWRSTWGCGRGIGAQLEGVAGDWRSTWGCGRGIDAQFEGGAKERLLKTNQNITREFQKWRDLKIKSRTRENTGKKSTK